jgi:hypothetical protein
MRSQSQTTQNDRECEADFYLGAKAASEDHSTLLSKSVVPLAGDRGSNPVPSTRESVRT